MTRSVFLLALLACLSSCAPMIVGRTPKPAAPGTFEVTVAGGYPVSLTTIPQCDVGNLDYFCNDGFESADYYPLGSPVSILIAQGLGGESEINYTLGVSQPILLPLLRVGGKTRFYDEEVTLAADYGLFGGFSNAGLDAGLLASMPLEGAELYGALRGFGNFYYNTGAYNGNPPFGVTGALTLGVETEISFARGIFAELTFATSGYNGVDIFPRDQPPGGGVLPLEVQQIGFSILPAIGIHF